MDAEQFQQDNIAGEGLGEFGVDHGMAAILDDDGLVVIALQVRQRFGQGAGRQQGLGLGVGHGPGV